MNKKTIRNIAIVIVLVFAITVIVYPMLFNPDSETPLAPAAPVAPMK